ncbi:MAG: class I SAM-dependent methyltransferase [Sphingobium sp.]
MDRFESMLAPLGEALLARARLGQGERVIDIGCGGGWTSRAAAAVVGPTGSVRGVDISPLLVQEAARRAKGIANLAFTHGDAATDPIPGAPFDRMISRLGVMFFADPVRAFTRLHGLLVGGGQLDWAVWAAPEDNPWMSGARRIAAQFVEMAPPDPDGPGPFSLRDPEVLADRLAQAGFGSISIVAWEGHHSVGGAGADPQSAAEFALTAFSFADALQQVPTAVRDAISAELTRYYGSYFSEGRLAVPAKAWLVQARAA